jgi:hypothetical protein
MSEIRIGATALARHFLSIIGGFTPLTLSEVASRYCVPCAPYASYLDGVLWWVFLVFAGLALVRAAYLAGREVERDANRGQRCLSVDARSELMKDRRTGAVVALDLRREIAVVIAKSDSESARFALDLCDSLETSGWTTKVVPIDPPPAGHLIEVQILGDDRPSDIDAILEALRLSGLAHSVRTVKGDTGGLPGGGFINIVVPRRRANGIA